MVFATQRGDGEFKGRWEFLDGKIEEAETPQVAFVRKMREEVETEIIVGGLSDTNEYDYPAFHFSMECISAEFISGDLVLMDHDVAS